MKITINETTFITDGVVTSVAANEKGVKLSLNVSEYDGEAGQSVVKELDVLFNRNEKSNLPDRLEKLNGTENKLVGQHILVECYSKQEGNSVLGNNFLVRGKYHRTINDREQNFIIGTACGAKKTTGKDGSVDGVRVSVATEEKDGTVWNTVSIRNGLKSWNQNMGNNAVKFFFDANGEKRNRKVLLVCGEDRPWTNKDGEEVKNCYNAFRFEVLE